MKKILPLLILCAWLAPNTLSARHILGGSMGYYYTTDGQMKVEMVIYRDCWDNGAPFDIPAEIAVYKPSGELFTTFSLNDYQSKNIEVDSSSCFSDFSSCIERGIYTFPLSLPDDGNNYLVVYQRCCRGADISNLVNPNDVGFTIEVEITSQARISKNSSPRWITDPVFNICAHQQKVLDLAAAEPEGDLVVYSFCQPLVGGGPITTTPDVFSCIGAKPTPPCPPPYDEVPFAVPIYNFNNPLGSANSQLNPINGGWNITADYIGKFNYAVCVQEYRNGVLHSNTRRDLTLWVNDLVGTNETPGFGTITCSPNPAGHAVVLSTEMFEGNTIQIELSDLSGKIWLAEKRMNVASKEPLNVDALPSGVYLVKVSANGKTASGMFIRK